MRTEKITYTDIVTGKQVTGTFYFNITETELAEMNFDINGGFEGLMQSLNDNPERSHIVKVFKTLLGKAVMEKTPDGKRFVKSEDITNEFLGSDAYSELFKKLAFNNDYTYGLEFLADTIMGFDHSVVDQAKADPDYLNKIRAERLGNDVQAVPEVIDEVMPDA